MRFGSGYCARYVTQDFWWGEWVVRGMVSLDHVCVVLMNILDGLEWGIDIV